MITNLLFSQLTAIGKRFAMVLTMLLIVGIGQAWGAAITIQPSSKCWTTTLGAQNGTINGITISTTTGSLYYNSNNNPTQFRINSGATFSVASSVGNITKIDFTFTGASYQGGLKTSYTNLNSTSWSATLTGNARIQKIVVTYAEGPVYTVTWTINPAAGGSLSPTSGNTTTVTPDAAYTYGSPAYTVTSGSASVSQNGNTFTATPTANSTIQINMVEKPKYTVTFDAGSGSCSTPNFTQTSTTRSIDLPTATTTCEGWTFAGWCISSAGNEDENSTSPGTILLPGDPYTPSSNHTLYAVYTRSESGGTATSYVKVSADNVTTGTYVIAAIRSSSVSLNYYPATGSISSGDMVVSDKTFTLTNETFTEIPDGGIEFTFTGDNTNGFTINNGSGNLGYTSNSNRKLAFGDYTTKWKVYDHDNPQAGVYLQHSDGSSYYTITENSNGTTPIRGYASNTKYRSIYLFKKGNASTTYYMTNLICSTQPSVTLNPNGGDFDPKPNGWTQEGENYKKEGVTGAITLPTPTRTGYDFKGWYDAASGGTEIADGGEDYTPSEDIVLYAQWDPITYTIRLNPGSGSCDNNQISGTYSEGVKLPTASPSNACIEEGWTFAGWATASVNETTTAPTTLYDANQTYNPTTNIELYAVYVKQTFTLSLVDNSTTYYVGGYESSKSILTAETDVNNAMDFRIVDGQYLRCESGYISHNSASSTNISCYPSKDGNVFPWTITENTGTISFQSTKAEGNIRYLGYNYNSGNPRFAVYVESYAHNFTKNTTTTYTTDPNCCTQLAEITGLTFSAMTRSITVSVPDSYDNTNVDGYIFNLYNAATGGVATTYDTNDKNEKSHTFTGLTPNTAYHFTIIAKGSGAYCNSEETSPRESYTTLPQYTVTWNPAGGNWSGSTADKVDTYDYQAEITKPADPERTGYTFNGWNTTPETIMPAENLTYTAQWNIVTYTITYENLNGATHTNPKDYTVETAPIALTDPTERAGYVFAGWYSDANYTTKVTQIPQGSTGNITLYAKWLEIFTITWMVNGKVSSTTEVVEGEPITPPASPDAGDYCGQVFVGWTNAEMAETTNVAPTLYPTPTPFPTATKETPTTFYAVFADYEN